MRKLSIIFFIIIISLFLVCCNEKNIDNNDNFIPTETNDNKPEEDKIEDEKDNEIEDYSNAIFTSNNGTGDGSKDNPCALRSAINRLSSNKNRIYIIEGTYNFDSAIILNSNGRKDLYYELIAFNNGKVIFDFGKDYRKEKIITNSFNTEKSKGIVIKGNYYYIKGITIKNAGAHGMHISGSFNKIENCILACNGNTGLNISSSKNNPKDTWAHDNYILNCTSYGNYDWDRDTDQGEDADGFGAKVTAGENNTFDGCISYNNSDDGWDLFTQQKTGAVGSSIIKNCVAFNNGYSIDYEDLKNGNGFKLGGRAIEVDHTVINSIAFNNKANGFDDNSNPGTITIKNCTAYNNGKRNYSMGRFLEDNDTYNSTWYEGNDLMGPIYNVPKTHHVFENCISYNGGIKDSFSGTAKNCYFYNVNGKYNVFRDLAICNSKYNLGVTYDIFNPFESLNFELNDLENIHYLLRNDDGSINLGLFLKIKNQYSFGANLNN